MAFNRIKGNVLIKNPLTNSDSLISEQSDLLIYPISMDPNIYQDFKTSEDNEKETNAIQALIGTRDGAVYIYDPILIMNGNVLSFNSDNNMPFFKNRRPEIVKWIEPLPSDKPAVNKFAVVFDDGCIYIYEKDVPYNAKEDYAKSMIKLPKSQK